MNRFMQEQWGWVEGSHAMRTQLLDVLTDADLSFTPGGQAMTLGALCREMGDVQHSYNQSLKTFTQSWDYRHPDPEMERSVSKLKAWFQALEDEMKATASAFSDADLDKMIDRGGGFTIPVKIQFDIYLQALLIFFGKATIYLRVMNKPLPQQIHEWIG